MTLSAIIQDTSPILNKTLQLQSKKAIFLRVNTLYIHKRYLRERLLKPDSEALRRLGFLCLNKTECYKKDYIGVFIMAIGARDFIDKLLVEKYAQEKVDNHDESALVSRVNADDIMSAMNQSANNFRTMLALNNRLTMVCYGVVAKSAKYVCTEEAA